MKRLICLLILTSLIFTLLASSTYAWPGSTSYTVQAVVHNAPSYALSGAYGTIYRVNSNGSLSHLTCAFVAYDWGVFKAKFRNIPAKINAKVRIVFGAYPGTSVNPVRWSPKFYVYSTTGTTVTTHVYW